MDQPYLRKFESQCTQEEPPACQTMCPLHVEARAFAGLMARGKLDEARKTLERSMPLAGLTGRLCAGDCVAHCRRAEVDAGVAMPLLERACVALTGPGRLMALPSTGKRIAVAGAGLSSLACAFELGKKGHAVTIFYTGPIGGRLCGLSETELPKIALDGALEQLASLRVVFETVDAFTPVWRDGALERHLALYAGLDDTSCALAALGLGGIRDFLTQETEHPKVFAGGLLGGTHDFVAGRAAPSFVREAADGKRAAGSVTRLLQGVAPSSARDREGVYPTALFTDVAAVDPVPPVIPANPAAPTGDEAAAEAARCIQCECLECVKRCAYLAHYKGYPKKYAREIYNNLAMVHGVRRANTQIDSCALCGLCASVCPNGADMGAFCFAARREMVAARRMPVSAHEFALEDMAHSTDPEVAFFRHEPGLVPGLVSGAAHGAASGSASGSAPDSVRGSARGSIQGAWAFFPGCQLPATLPEQSRKVYDHLRGHLTGGVGLFFHCCGAPARWSGRPELTSRNAEAVREAWQRSGGPTLILACASCAEFFAAELPDIPSLSLWDVLADLPLPEGARTSAAALALHDPCAARKTPATRDSVRKLLTAMGQTVEELPLGRDLTRCCGYGGLADAANPDMGRAYARSRADDSASPMAAWCAMCRDRLRAAGKPALHLLDLLFPSGAPEEAAARPAPGISERQRGRLDFRRAALAELWHEEPQRNPHMEDMQLRISDDVAARLEARRILHTDIKAVILHAEAEGPQFSNPQTGRCLSSLRPKQVTYWVEYEKEPGGVYVIHDAYCHRMVVPGVPGEGRPTAVILEGHDPMGGRV